MADKIILLEVDVDTDAAVKDTIRLKEELEVLKAQAQAAREKHGELSAEYLKYQAAIKSTQADIKTQENLTQKLTGANAENAGTLTKLAAENAKLRVEQKGLNLETKEGIARNKEINTKINENTDFIKKNSDSLVQNKMNVGNYAGALKDMGVGQAGVVQGFLSMAKAAYAFIATPIGAILALIAGAAALVGKAFGKSEESMNKLKTVTGALSGLFDGLLKVLKPVVEFLANTVIVTFEALGKVADKTLGLISKGLSFLGFKEAAKAVDNFANSMKEAAKAGEDLAKAEAELQKLQREARLIQLEYQKQAEKQRQIRDDESNSLKERIKANEKLNQILQDQLKEELKIANKALEVADLRLKKEGESTEALDQRAEALTNIADIEERVNGQRSEYLANLNALRKEEQAFADERRKAEEAWNNLLIESEKVQEQARIDQANARVLKDREKRKKEKEIRLADEALAFENEMQIKILRGESEFDIERERLLRLEAEEIKAAERLGQNVLLVQQKYSLAKQQIDRAEVAARMTAYAGMAGNIAELFGKQTKIGKIAASAQTAINTYLGAQSVFAQTPGGIVIKSIAAGLATAVGLKNIAAIWAVKSGLPGDGGGGTTTQVAPSAINVNPSIGNGIVAREAPQQTNQVTVSTQPTLVVDSVTAAQQQQTRINETLTI